MRKKENNFYLQLAPDLLFRPMIYTWAPELILEPAGGSMVFKCFRDSVL